MFRRDNGIEEMIKEIDVHTAAAWLKNDEAILVDVREVEENRQLRIPGAVLLPLSSFDADRVPAVEDRKVVVYCAMGGRSREAVMRCHYSGVEAINLAGGIFAWQHAGLPTESG